jgi:hypothetical protein
VGVTLGTYSYNGTVYTAVKGRGYWAKHPAYLYAQYLHPGYEIRFNAPVDIELGQPHNEMGRVWIYYPPGSFTQEPGFYGWLSYYIDYIQIVYGCILCNKHLDFYVVKYEGVNRYYKSFYVKGPDYGLSYWLFPNAKIVEVFAWKLGGVNEGRDKFIDVYVADPSAAVGEPIGFAGDCRLYFSQQKAALLQRGVGLWPW